MEHLKDFASEFSKPFAICFDLLAKSNISIYNETKSIRDRLRSLVLVVLYVTFYASLVISFKKIVTGDLGFYELANLLPVFIVATQVFYWMNIVGTWQYILVPLFETLFRDFILGQDKLLFPFICTFPYDAKRNWIVYLVTYFWESYSMFHLVYMYLGVELLLITMCSHLATEFELLREDMLHENPILGNIGNAVYKFDNNKPQGYYPKREYEDVIYDVEEDITNVDIRLDEDGPRIEEVIRRHQKLIKLSVILDDIFNQMIFFNLLFATITICFFGFVAKIARDPLEMANNFVAVIASMIPIFNLCYYSELLSAASAGVADSAYHNMWYEGDVRYQKIIIFIIVRSQKPCSLTSMRYAEVNLNTFTTVLSTTWSYFSLAISVYET